MNSNRIKDRFGDYYCSFYSKGVNYMDAITEKEQKTINANNNSMVDHPNHYNRENAIECIDEMEMIYGTEALMHFCLLSAHKYRYRAGLKNNGFEDIEKSDWYMKKYKELKEKQERVRLEKPLSYII